MGFIIDDEFRTLIPPLTDDEFARLEKSVLAEGVREPIITWNNTIIDGHNRYRICESYGLECPNSEREFASRDAAKLFIIDNQLRRRNLAPAAIGLLKLEEKEIVARRAKERQGARNDIVPNLAQSSESGRTLDQLAKDIPLGRESLRKLDVIKRKAEEGDETAIEARAALQRGEKKSIHRAYVAVVGKPEPRRLKDTVADDGRRICVFCGEPVIEQYQDKQGWCYSCGLKHATDMQRNYRDASRDLRENVPTYTIESLLAQLTASAESMRRAWEQTIEINESMGVKLKAADKKRLEKAMAYPSEMLERIKESQK